MITLYLTLCLVSPFHMSSKLYRHLH